MAYAPALSNTRADWAIDLTHVSKTYDKGFRRAGVHALRGVDMRVRKGEVFGLLGPNGAGKSTLVKILMTVIRPTRAEGTLLGAPVGVKETLARVGYLPEHHRFPDYLTGEQVVDFYGAMCGVPRAVRRARTPALLELVGMRDWARTRVQGYSKGMRQRVGIAQALAANPDLVVLDEPTDGVDPVGRRDIREVLQRIRAEGKTVFLNSHLLSELEMVCDRVAIMVQGLVSSQGTIDELTVDKRRYELEVVGSAGQAASSGTSESDAQARFQQVKFLVDESLARSGVLGRPGIGTPEVSSALNATGGASGADAGALISLPKASAADVQPLIDALRARGLTIRSMREVRPSLEDLFMQAVTDPTTGKMLLPGAKR